MKTLRQNTFSQIWCEIAISHEEQPQRSTKLGCFCKIHLSLQDINKGNDDAKKGL